MVSTVNLMVLKTLMEEYTLGYPREEFTGVGLM